MPIKSSAKKDATHTQNGTQNKLRARLKSNQTQHMGGGMPIKSNAKRTQQIRRTGRKINYARDYNVIINIRGHNKTATCTQQLVGCSPNKS